MRLLFALLLGAAIYSLSMANVNAHKNDKYVCEFEPCN